MPGGWKDALGLGKRVDPTDPRFTEADVRQEDVRLAEEAYWIDADMDATDPEHLEVDNSPNDYSHQGLVDSITEGTISVPHTPSAAIAEAMIDQAEIDQAAEEIVKTAMSSPLDVAIARRLRIRRFTLNRISAAADGTAVRLLTTDHLRRYFVLFPDTAASLVWLSTSPFGSAGDPNTFPYANTMAPSPQMFHQGELWGACDKANASSSFTVLEFMGD